MTATEAIKRSVALYPECGERSELMAWLSELEAKIYVELYGGKSFTALTSASVLSAPDSYAELYPYYLVMKTDLVNADIERYNNSVSLFETAYSEFANYVNRMSETSEITYYKFT